MSGGESGHREASGRGALRVPIPPPPPSADLEKKRAKRARQKAEAAAKASASKSWERQAAFGTDETDPGWRKKQERAVEHNARTTRMYTNFLRVAKQLWVKLPSSNWCSSDYDVTMPDYGKHVDPDFNYELIDQKKIDQYELRLSTAEKNLIENMKKERSNRAISARYQAVTETWRDTVTLSLQASITEEIKEPKQLDREKDVDEPRMYDPQVPINLRIRAEHNLMPNSCKSDIRYDPSYTFRLPVTMVPDDWFRSDDEKNSFYRKFQATEYTLRWPELIDTVNSHYPVQVDQESWANDEVVEPSLREVTQQMTYDQTTGMDAVNFYTTPHWAAVVADTITWITQSGLLTGWIAQQRCPPSKIRKNLSHIGHSFSDWANTELLARSNRMKKGYRVIFNGTWKAIDAKVQPVIRAWCAHLGTTKDLVYFYDTFRSDDAIGDAYEIACCRLALSRNWTSFWNLIEYAFHESDKYEFDANQAKQNLGQARNWVLPPGESGHRAAGDSDP